VDEWILGSGEFVERVLREADGRRVRQDATKKMTHRGPCRCSGMRRKQGFANRAAKRQPAGATARRARENSAKAGKGLRVGSGRSRPSSGHLDFWSVKDADAEFVQLVNNVPGSQVVKYVLVPPSLTIKIARGERHPHWRDSSQSLEPDG
jgi:hypothetical protein